MSKEIRLGKLPPRYAFFLNPYADVRFTRCPKCEGKSRLRKLPLVIHIEPHYFLSLNKTCRYCPGCELLIAHQDELEALLTAFFEEHQPDIIGNDYLVLGTMERAAWKRGLRQPRPFRDVVDQLHDFKRVLRFELRGGWSAQL